MISVALCTYNGEKYIEQQIVSIIEQSRSVDEIVICDDGSSDNTLTIISRIKQNSIVDIRLIETEEKHVGVVRNFQRCCDCCRGDVVFLSDQDDVWYKDKVKTILDYYDAHPLIDVVFTNADLIDSEGMKRFSSTLFDHYFTKEDRDRFDRGEGLVCFAKNHATGATMAIRKSFLENNRFADYKGLGICHDHIIALMAANRNTIGYINVPLIAYRQHEKQTIGIFKLDDGYDAPINEFMLPCLMKASSSDRLNVWFSAYQFSAWRRGTKHQLYGPLNIMLHAVKYYRFYGSAFLKMMLYDIGVSVRHTNKRISRKVGGAK